MLYLFSIKGLIIFCFSFFIKLFDLTAETEKICLKGTFLSGGQKEALEVKKYE
jgi:hypothetical protein